MTAPVSALKLNDVPVYDARKSGVIADGTTNNAAALQSALWMTVSQGLGIRQLPAGTIKCNSVVTWPTASNLTLRGQGIGATVLEFASSTTGGIVYNVATRISRCFLREFSIHGNGAVSGDDCISDWDRGGIELVRAYAWNNCLKITSTGALGALHTEVNNCIITNGVVNCVWLTGAQGPHQTHIRNGEISIGGTGLRVDSPTDQTHVYGTSLESNAQAILSAGARGHYMDVRFEGNTQDTYFTSTSLYNVLETSFFDRAKHRDESATLSNRVIAHGFAASATERKPTKFIPIDPMCVTLISIVPGTKLAVSHLFEVYEEALKVETLSYVPSVQNGNVDIAICDTAGAILASTGSTAVGVAGTKQDIALASPIYIGPGRQYYIALMFDNATAGFNGFTSTSAGFNLGQGEVLAREKTITNFPFDSQNAVAGGSGTTKTLFARLG